MLYINRLFFYQLKLRKPTMDEEFYLQYAINKQLPSMYSIMSNYGEFELDDEMKKAVQTAYNAQKVPFFSTPAAKPTYCCPLITLDLRPRHLPEGVAQAALEFTRVEKSQPKLAKVLSVFISGVVLPVPPALVICLLVLTSQKETSTVSLFLPTSPPMLLSLPETNPAE